MVSLVKDNELKDENDKILFPQGDVRKWGNIQENKLSIKHSSS